MYHQVLKLEHSYIRNQSSDLPEESIFLDHYLYFTSLSLQSHWLYVRIQFRIALEVFSHSLLQEILLFGIGLKGKALLFLVSLGLYFLSTYRNKIFQKYYICFLRTNDKQFRLKVSCSFKPFLISNHLSMEKEAGGTFFKTQTHK